MTYVIDKHTVGMWWFQLDPEIDVMIGLSQDEREHWLAWRFRYHAGTPDEHKNWYSQRGPAATTEEIVAKTRAALAGFKAKWESQHGPILGASELLMGEGGLAAFVQAMQAHVDFTSEVHGASSSEEALRVIRELQAMKPKGSA